MPLYFTAVSCMIGYCFALSFTFGKSNLKIRLGLMQDIFSIYYQLLFEACTYALHSLNFNVMSKIPGKFHFKL